MKKGRVPGLNQLVVSFNSNGIHAVQRFDDTIFRKTVEDAIVEVTIKAAENLGITTPQINICLQYIILGICKPWKVVKSGDSLSIHLPIYNLKEKQDVMSDITVVLTLRFSTNRLPEYKAKEVKAISPQLIDAIRTIAQALSKSPK